MRYHNNLKRWPVLRLKDHRILNETVNRTFLRLRQSAAGLTGAADRFIALT